MNEQNDRMKIGIELEYWNYESNQNKSICYLLLPIYKK